jgi:hypothetical protein
MEGESVEQLLHHFGSVQTCGIALFMTLTGGEDWEHYYDALFPLGMARFVFILYVCVSHLTLLNVVTGIFVDNALKLSQPDHHQKAEDQRLHDKEMARALKHIFTTADKDGSHRLSKVEFQEVLETGRLKTMFSYLGIDPMWSRRNLPLLFDRMVENSELYTGGEDPEHMEVDTHTFVETCMALRGNARSTEVMDLHELIIQIEGTLEIMCEHLGLPTMITHRGHDMLHSDGDDDEYE